LAEMLAVNVTVLAQCDNSSTLTSSNLPVWLATHQVGLWCWLALLNGMTKCSL